MHELTNLAQLILSGILIGAIYGLVATGFVVTYRTVQVFNIAYGEFAVLGAFIAWTLIGSPGEPRLPLPLAIVLAIVAAVILGLLVERLFFRRLLGKPVYVAFIASLGLMSVLYGITMLVWGPGTRVFARTLPTGPVHLGGVVLGREFIWSSLIAVIVVLGFWLFLRKTKMGLGMRASYDNQVAARCLGVSARLNSQIAWAMCAVIATTGGILTASVAGVDSSLSNVVMVVLVVALVGGMDSIVGAMLGGLILAIGTNLVSFYLNPIVPGVDTVFSMVLILFVLLVRPSGLLGVKPIERV